MSRIKETFLNKKAFMPFITIGDPSIEDTVKFIKTMESNGADIIQLGIPFSDPTGGGPVIQEANQKALENGVTTDKVFEMLENLRKETLIPIAIMAYANVIFSYGIENFSKKAKEVQIDAVIVPDVPYEEREEFESVFKKYDIDFINIITPSSKHRIPIIAKDATGFIYCMTPPDIGVVQEMVQEIQKSNPQIPTAFGFGIKDENHAKQVARCCDAIVIEGQTSDIIRNNPQNLGAYVNTMKQAIN